MMNAPRLTEPTIAHAEFSADGALVASTPGFLTEGLGGLDSYLSQFEMLDDERAGDTVVAAAARRWREPGAVINARRPGGQTRTLCSHPTAAGGITMLSVESAGQKLEDVLSRKVLERHPMPIWINDVKNGNVLMHNARARQLFEIDAQSPGGGKIADMFTNPDEKRRVLNQLRANGRIENYTISAQTLSGRPFWLYGAATLFRHEGEEVVLCVVHDVTTLKEQDNEAQRARSLLNDALRALNEGCALFDEDGRLIVCNDRYREINSGILEFITPGVYWETLLHETARRRIALHAAGREGAWVSEILRLSESEESFEIERKDGTATSVTVRPTSLGGFIVSETDITARRRAEQSAQDSEQMLSTILEASPANLCMSQIGDGEIIYQSPACIDLFGTSGSARDQFADSLDRADFLTELLPSGRIDDFSARARRPNGETFPALFSARVIDYRGEEVMVSTVTDLTDQVAAERTIHEAGIRLRDAIEALSEGFILFDSNAKVVMANQRYLEMNAPIANLIVPGADNRDLLVAAIETGHLVDAEMWLEDHEQEVTRGAVGSQRAYEFQLTDGTWVNSIRRPTRDGGFVITWLDVTERKVAAMELELVNHRMRDAIESLDEGFALYDAEDRLVMWNRCYEEMNKGILEVIREGVTYNEILETAIETHKLPDDEIEKVRESGRRDIGNHRRSMEFMHKDGRWFSVTRNPTSENGFVITRLDITERKEREAAEREAYQLPQRILDACPAALVMSRLDTGENIYRNPEDRALYGDARPSRDFWVDQKQRTKFLGRVALSGAVDEMQVEMRRPDGTVFQALMSARSVDFRGEPFMVTYTFDLSERIAMERELSRQQEMLHQSEKLSALGELLAGVAHELNNPLSVVVGHSLMLQEEIEDEALLARTEKISSAAERCSRIVKTFLSMARQRPAKMELTPVNMVIETALDVAGYGLRSAGVAIELDLPADLPPVNADADQLAQVFANLIVNAEHVLSDMGTDGCLKIATRLSSSGREIVIDVTDNGPGIPEAIRARVFEPFFTTKTIGEGTGIGLAFCHRIIEVHEGRISVGEAPGGGAHFTIRLAVSTETPEDKHSAQSATAKRGSVLVIDDEAEVADLITHVLRRDDYQVRTVHSAEAALEVLPGDFDVILSDVNMPGLGGRNLLTAIKERWPGLESRLGFITGDTMSPGAEQFLDLAGRPYLEKPVTPSDLRQLAAQLINDQ